MNYQTKKVQLTELNYLITSDVSRLNELNNEKVVYCMSELNDVLKNEEKRNTFFKYYSHSLSSTLSNQIKHKNNLFICSDIFTTDLFLHFYTVFLQTSEATHF